MTYPLSKMFAEAKIPEVPAWFSEVEIVHPVWGTPIAPRQHQITGLNFLFLRDRSSLYDEQGTGKTLTAQAYCAWHAGMGNKVLCLMPPILMSQFRDSFLKGFKGISNHLKCCLYGGDKKKRQKLATEWEKGWPDIVIMSYEIFLKEWPLFSDYCVLVADEAKVMGNENNKCYQAIQAFMGPWGEKLSVLMNGTPASTDIRPLYGYIAFNDPAAYRNRQHFELLHVDYQKIDIQLKEERTTSVLIPAGYKALELLHAILYQTGRRVEKKDVLDLPEKNIIPVEFDLTPEHYKRYRQFVTEKLMIFDDNTLLDGTTSAGMRNHAMQGVMHTDIFQLVQRSAVIDAIEGVIEKLDLTKEKFFILCHHQKTVELIAQELRRHKLAIIYGKTANPEREKDKFYNDPDCHGCVANWVAGGVGLNFQENCCTVIIAEPTAVPSWFDQGTDRVHRSGQKNTVNVYVMLPAGTIYNKVVATMTKRHGAIKKVVSCRSLMNELMGGIEDQEQEEEEDKLFAPELDGQWIEL